MFRYLVVFFILIGCKSGPDLMIKGHLPDASTDGEWIFLVPVENASKERVDSVMIMNGAFQFKESVAVPEIYIIRAKPVLRLTLQELLVVKEPGVLVVNIGNNSFASGTALNDSLQKWKEKKMMADRIYFQLLAQYKAADKISQPIIKQKADSLNAQIVDFHFNFVRNNRNNVVGNFVKKMMEGSFSPEQKQKLSIQ